MFDGLERLSGYLSNYRLEKILYRTKDLIVLQGHSAKNIMLLGPLSSPELKPNMKSV